ncbi:ASCH domain-containing protein [Schaalia sp. Marseille-Q2122]|uniref:ASCH domain-containing protein n=1 Tax=Schaalia sp. Marseille-Q2122 TaxID=2736604 RepID=UPI00158B28FA|nr:ASCH domain-containing protein [Schaalia sp. Marseille-Q2122]
MSETSSIESFWQRARLEHPELPEEPAEAWAFGATPEMADELLVLVLAGIKTGTASSLWDYQAEGEALPHVGQLNIILDGVGVPCAIVETTAVDIVPFNEVSAEHAFAEGEGDRSLEYWRMEHERFWRTYGAPPPTRTVRHKGNAAHEGTAEADGEGVGLANAVDALPDRGAAQAGTAGAQAGGFAEDMPVVCERFRLLYP